MVAPRAAPSLSIPCSRPLVIPREGAPSRREYLVVIRWPVARYSCPAHSPCAGLLASLSRYHSPALSTTLQVLSERVLLTYCVLRSFIKDIPSLQSGSNLQWISIEIGLLYAFDWNWFASTKCVHSAIASSFNTRCCFNLMNLCPSGKSRNGVVALVSGSGDSRACSTINIHTLSALSALGACQQLVVDESPECHCRK